MHSKLQPQKTPSFIVLFVSLGPQKDALVGFDTGEGCWWNEAAVDQVVLQVNRQQQGVLTGRSITQRVHSDVATRRRSG